MSQRDDIILGEDRGIRRQGPTSEDTRELAEATYRFVLFVGRWLRRVYGF